MPSPLVEIATAALSDVLGVSGVAFPALKAELAKKLFEVFAKRDADAKSELLAALRDGRETLDEDELAPAAAAVYRYGRAAKEGAARINLRMLANVLAGQVNRREMNTDDFLSYADLISSLRVNEIIVLGHLIRFDVMIKPYREGDARGVTNRRDECFESLDDVLGIDRTYIAIEALSRTGLLMQVPVDRPTSAELGLSGPGAINRDRQNQFDEMTVGTILLSEFASMTKLQSLFEERFDPTKDPSGRVEPSFQK